MEPGWILDDMVLQHLADVFHEETFGAAWQSVELLLAEATWDAAVRGRARRRASFLRRCPARFERIGIAVPAAGPPSRAFEVFTAIRAGDQGHRNLAECQAIAWAACRPERSVVFVTQDKAAAMLALAELGRARVAHPLDLWLALRAQGCLDEACYEALCRRTARLDGGHPPVRSGVGPRAASVRNP